MINKVYRKVYSILARLRVRLKAIVRTAFGWVQPEEELINESRDYWKSWSNSRLKSHSHWREGYAFDSPGVWERLGRQHRELLLRAASQAGVTELRRIVDWGCGGGLNAVQLAADAQCYYGVDVSELTLEECKRQVSLLDVRSFQPVLIDAANPESCLQEVGEPCDAFICTYVFELLPTREYGWRLVRLAHSLLRPGGIALIHFRYFNNLFQLSRRWRYAKNLAHNTAYKLAEFRNGAAEIGFEVLFEEVIPKQDDLNECRYAFFALKKV
jgi:SAM-dependent methyltransferase